MKIQPTNFFLELDFRKLILREYESRLERRPSYSMRAFARDIEIRPTTLADILRGRSGCSPSLARVMAERFGFDAEETNYFCDLVASKFARNQLQKEAAKARVDSRHSFRLNALSEEALNYLSNWRYPVIMQLLTIGGVERNPSYLASALGAEESVIKTDLDYLLKLGAISKTRGQFVTNKDFHHVIGDRQVPSKIIRSYHAQLLELAVSAIELQPIEIRKFQSAVFGIEKSKLQKARKRIEEFHDLFLKEFASDRPDQVYSVNFQLFRLDQDV